MKKLITILTIMIVLVGSVFAVNQEGSATINITASIAEEIPSFQLNIKADEDATEGQPAVEVGGDAATTSFTDDSVDLLKTGHDVEVHFEITQVGNARLGVNSAKHIYHFTVAASNLILQNAAEQTDNTVFTVKNGTPTINSLSTNSAASQDISVIKDVDDGGQTTIVTATVSAGSVTYKGGLVEDETVIGNFVAGWHGNAGAAPGTYKATVTLTVTSE